MKSQSLQEMVKSIFIDETIKEQFMANPDSVMSRYNLTENERAAVINTSSRYGLATSDSPALAVGIEAILYWL
ncbi:MAG TPA: hypothetical protein DCR71_04245 [Dehalococcoidia bacterium]|nr:hypothetical protein [Dehalococcoidia bacterium]HAS28504.1 hypothetical protein [Dehalococcoidia bacterium]